MHWTRVLCCNSTHKAWWRKALGSDEDLMAWLRSSITETSVSSDQNGSCVSQELFITIVPKSPQNRWFVISKTDAILHRNMAWIFMCNYFMTLTDLESRNRLAGRGGRMRNVWMRERTPLCHAFNSVLCSLFL